MSDKDQLHKSALDKLKYGFVLDLTAEETDYLIEQLVNVEKLTRIAIEADEGCEYWRDKYKQMQNTVKETLEILKRGGPGTRSQVQRLLEQALEG